MFKYEVDGVEYKFSYGSTLGGKYTEHLFIPNVTYMLGIYGTRTDEGFASMGLIYYDLECASKPYIDPSELKKNLV